MTTPEFTDHSNRKPVCDCGDEQPTILGEGTPVQFVKCGSCSGIIKCTFCDNDARSWTPGADYVCKSCGDEILSNV